MKSSKLQNSFSKSDTWPEAFGFTIYGKGPTHIIKVVPGSVAAQSGLKAGDQILQVNSHDVSGWGDDDIISHVSKLSQHPPSLGVVSRIREVTLQPSPISNEFGFSLIGTFPVKIHQIKSESPSDEANLIRNDLVIKVRPSVCTYCAVVLNSSKLLCNVLDRLKYLDINL
ncbi:Na(+)/H(+) exchange regulatory cofactor NHE-RF3-like [Styela clava]